MVYLDDNPPAVAQFRDPRREEPSGVIVVHTSENSPDIVGFDGGSEAVANWIRIRTDPGSYHDIADSDSYLPTIRYDCEAFHDATGSNRHSYGVSAATRADIWPLVPQAWKDGCVFQMARAASAYAIWLKNRTGILIPAVRITRAQSELRIPGFISHAQRDPARRTDPGAWFPWSQFLFNYSKLTMQDEPDEEEEVNRTIRWLKTSGGDGRTPYIVEEKSGIAKHLDNAALDAARYVGVDEDTKLVPYNIQGTMVIFDGPQKNV